MEDNKNVWIWIFVVVALLFLLGSLGMGGYGMMGVGTGFGFLFMLLFWGSIIWLVATLVNASQSSKDDSDSLIILKKRYAKGEISKKEFERMKKEIN
jgi:putative membrane protein